MRCIRGVGCWRPGSGCSYVFCKSILQLKAIQRRLNASGQLTASCNREVERGRLRWRARGPHARTGARHQRPSPLASCTAIALQCGSSQNLAQPRRAVCGCRNGPRHAYTKRATLELKVDRFGSDSSNRWRRWWQRQRQRDELRRRLRNRRAGCRKNWIRAASTSPLVHQIVVRLERQRDCCNRRAWLCASSEDVRFELCAGSTSRATTLSAELSGASNLAAARSLNACPYRAT